MRGKIGNDNQEETTQLLKRKHGSGNKHHFLRLTDPNKVTLGRGRLRLNNGPLLCYFFKKNKKERNECLLNFSNALSYWRGES